MSNYKATSSSEQPPDSEALNIARPDSRCLNALKNLVEGVGNAQVRSLFLPNQGDMVIPFLKSIGGLCALRCGRQLQLAGVQGSGRAQHCCLSTDDSAPLMTCSTLMSTPIHTLSITESREDGLIPNGEAAYYRAEKSYAKSKYASLARFLEWVPGQPA